MTAIIHYFTLHDEQRKQEKLDWFQATKLSDINFQRIHPDGKGNWINQTNNDFESLVPMVDKEVKAGTTNNALFKLFTNSIKTNRDEWVYDFDKMTLSNKIKYFIEKYNLQLESHKKSDDELDYTIKWSSTLKENLYKSRKVVFDKIKIVSSLFHPFVKQYFYSEKTLCDRLTDNHLQIFGFDLRKSNLIINFLHGNRLEFSLLASSIPTNYALFSLDPIQNLPLYRYDKDGNRLDNITDWGLQQFRERYKELPPPAPPKIGGESCKNPLLDEEGVAGGQSITKSDIFHYVYAVLHNPAYRQKYELNLKRDFPRIPFYDDFHQWAAWGKALMDLHLNYETVEPYPLKRLETALSPVGAVHELPLEYASKAGKGQQTLPINFVKENQTAYAKVPKAKLKADKEAGRIILDEPTTLAGVPSIAWEYRLGNRSALEWVLDRYKEKTPSDPTIREKFNTYCFADYKEQVIELLMRVCTVSVKTMEIIGEMSGGNGEDNDCGGSHG